jgi:putative acetyltransferase
LDIRIADFDNADVCDLIALHQRRAYDASPPGTSFALDLAGLQRPEITLFELREGTRLLGIGALMALPDRTGEVKSMRTADAALRRGIGGAILAHIEAEARRRGYTKIVLETGNNEAYAPANALYRRHGFTRRGPFGDYAETGFNIFYEKVLEQT